MLVIKGTATAAAAPAPTTEDAITNKRRFLGSTWSRTIALIGNFHYLTIERTGHTTYVQIFKNRLNNCKHLS
jgi:hypothetical protein